MRKSYYGKRKWIREDLRAMRSCLEKIVNLTEEGLTGIKEEGRVRGKGGSALYSEGKEEGKKESPRKRMVEELRWKRRGGGWRESRGGIRS